MIYSEHHAPPAALVQALLHEAGMQSSPDRWALLGVSTSRVWALSIGNRRYVLRQRLDNDVRLARKELYLGTLLHAHGVPAAEVLAMVHGVYGTATLCSWLPGMRLDHAIARLSGAELDTAWQAAGAALRLVHQIPFPQAGEIVGDRIEPFAAGWNSWVLEDLADDIGWLQTRLGHAPMDAGRLERVLEAAVAVLADAPVRLLHNDALPQNIMLAPGADGWRCSGWLDWEFARAGDPLWDLATLDFRPAGLVPPGFYLGYGAQPPEPQTSIYELLMATWRTRAELEHGSTWDWPPRQARLSYLARLPRQIDRLVELLGVR